MIVLRINTDTSNNTSTNTTFTIEVQQFILLTKDFNKI